MKSGKTAEVVFAGAGPGDPELITVKGMKALKRADIVVYAGSLVQEGMLKYCKKGVKTHNSASMTLSEITGVMVRGARAGKSVVRLQTGDPSLYGALGEQTEALENEGVPYRVIPGVSSAFASAAALKKELTTPETAQTVIFTRLSGRTKVPGRESLSSLSMHRATMCVFLSASEIERVVRELKKGYPASAPVAVVYRASWEDELKLTGTLRDIAGKVKEAGITRHALIIVGRAVGDGREGRRSKLYDRGFEHACRKR